MTTPFDRRRRRFLLGGATAAAGIALTRPLQRLYASHLASGTGLRDYHPYGKLYPTRDQTTGLEILKLPGGFTYQTFGWTGDVMDDDSLTPDRHDGMAVMHLPRGGFADYFNDEYVLMRNHERGTQPADSPLPIVGNGRAPVYDDFKMPELFAGLGGGTTALVFKNGRFTQSRATLGGTLVNCAGGPTPWGSWLTCEETVIRGSRIGARDHGYVYEVPAPQLGPASAVPIVDMGLMKHEAAAVDPRTGDVYLTEDKGPHSGFYRFQPHNRCGKIGALEKGGQLRMLRVIGADNADLIDVRQGDTFDVDWVTIANPDADPERMVPPAEGLAPISGTGKSGPYLQGEARGAARFSRGEGCCYHRGVVYFTDTNAGPAGKGVVWAYKPSGGNARVAGVLKAIFVSPHENAADNPDNITLSPRGGILVCEDGGGKTAKTAREFGTRLLGITHTGKAFVFAENHFVLESAIDDKPFIEPYDYRGSEFAGATFDPTGRYLFVNIQVPGITFAITGPWKNGVL